MPLVKRTTMLPTTSFEDRFGTNYAPTRDEIRAIQELVDAVEPLIVSLDAEIEALRQGRATCASFVTCHRALLSPIRQMPPDILRTIFSHCIPYTTPGNAMRSSEAPLLLAQICSHWRDLAIQTPTLWSTVCAKIPSPPQAQAIGWGLGTPPGPEVPFASFADDWRRKMESLVSLITLWLSRAGGHCPLTILFRDTKSYHHDIDQEPISRMLMSLLCSRSSQWAELDLQIVESSSSEEAFLSLSPSLAPNLQAARVAWQFCRATINQWDPNYRPPTPTSLHLLKATQLRRVYLDNLSAFQGKDIPVAWSNLTELYFAPNMSWSQNGCPHSYSLPLLRCCTNLVQCELKIACFAADAPVNGVSSKSHGQVRLPHLRRLMISEWCTGTDGSHLTFCDFLDLPVLESLTLSVATVDCNPDQNLQTLPEGVTLRPILWASGHTIRHLELGSICLPVDVLVDALKHTVGVTELAIDLSHVGGPVPSHLECILVDHETAATVYQKEVLRRLTVSPTTPSDSKSEPTAPLCPNLSVLKISFRDPSHGAMAALKILVESRGIGRRSKSISYIQDGRHPPAVVVPLDQVWVRITRCFIKMPDIGIGSNVPQNGPTIVQGPPLPRGWREEELNDGFEMLRIRVERRKYAVYGSDGLDTAGEDNARRPLQTFWEGDSALYERCP
jgi:F-box-like